PGRRERCERARRQRRLAVRASATRAGLARRRAVVVASRWQPAVQAPADLETLQCEQIAQVQAQGVHLQVAPLIVASCPCHMAPQYRAPERVNSIPTGMSRDCGLSVLPSIAIAGASLQATFNKFGDQLHTAHSSVTVTLNFGGSDAVIEQRAGGEVDLFL